MFLRIDGNISLCIDDDVISYRVNMNGIAFYVFDGYSKWRLVNRSIYSMPTASCKALHVISFKTATTPLFR